MTLLGMLAGPSLPDKGCDCGNLRCAASTLTHISTFRCKVIYGFKVLSISTALACFIS